MALWSADYSNAQDVQTSSWLDLNNNTNWIGCYTQTSTPAFAGHSGGPCPAIATSGYMVFSYGQTTVSQTFDLEYALQAAGTGLRINGYNYHWHVKNSNINGQQPGSYDPIAYIDVSLYNRDGSIAVTDRYDYGYHIPDWQIFGGTRTYSSPYSLANVKDFSVSITAKDSGFWAGYYGPEFDHILVSVNYSVDPCASDPMYSPTCPGYFEALQALLPPSVSTPEPVVAVAEVVTAEPVVEQVVQSVPQQTQQQAQQSTQEPTQTAQVAAQPSSQASSPEEKKESKGGGPSLSAVLSILKNEQDRISGVESKVVEAANEQAQAEADKTVEQAIAIAESSSSESAAASDTIQQAIAASSSSSQQQNDSSSQASGSQLSSIIQQQNSSAASSSLENISNNQSAEALGTGIDPNVILQNTGIQIENKFAPIVDVELPKLDAFKVGATTPADDFLEPKTFSVDQNQSQTNDSVKKPSQTNDLAVGVSFESLATTPAGFNQYNVVMKDVAFYEPKEIYKGQKNVDNVKALRQLASDKLHQEMVEQQYRR